MLTPIIQIILIIVVPGPIVGLRLTSISAAVLQVSWSSPEVTNGDIQMYAVMVKTQAGDLVFQQSVPRGLMTVLVTSLGKMVYYC